MMNILFWNLHKNPITGYVKECLLENRVDIAIFAEHDGLDREALARETGYRQVKGPEDEDTESEKHSRKRRKVVMFTSRNVHAILRQQEGRYSICTVSCGGETYLFVGLHLEDRFNYPKPAKRLMTIRKLLSDEANWEKKILWNHIIIIGDFNANPYDDELLQVDAFNAALFKDVIQKSETRKVDDESYRRFYNPVLNFLSENPRNYGSYYYNETSSPVWNCLDQILVSRSLSDRIMELRYLRTIGNTDLIKKIAPNDEISDHLPLLVRVEGDNSDECSKEV